MTLWSSIVYCLSANLSADRPLSGGLKAQHVIAWGEAPSRSPRSTRPKETSQPCEGGTGAGRFVPAFHAEKVPQCSRPGPSLVRLPPAQDQLDDPIGVAAARGSEQISDRLSANLGRHHQDVGGEHRHIGSAGGFALIVHQPLSPCEAISRGADGLDGTGAERHRLGRIGSILVERCLVRTRRGKAQSQACGKIEGCRPDRAATRATGRPGGQPTPRVVPGFLGCWRIFCQKPTCSRPRRRPSSPADPAFMNIS